MSIDDARRLLGVTTDSDAATIARAYRRLARAVHPDLCSDAAAAERFVELTAAYRAVSEHPRDPRPLRSPRSRSGPAMVSRAWAHPPLAPLTRGEAPIVAGPVIVRPVTEDA